jgi:undecaprenyl-diphosphatase
MRSYLKQGRNLLNAVPGMNFLLAQVGRLEKRTLAALSFAAVALFAFAKLAEEVVEGDTRAFDERVLLWLRNPADPSDPIGPQWVEEMMRDFTALGSTGVLVIVTLAVVGFLVISRKRQAALMVAGAIVSGMLLSQALKWGFARPRPELVPHAMRVYTQSFPRVYTQSFPSGHAMMAAVVYLTLGTLLARIQPRRRIKVYLLSVAMLVTMLVGVSRVYLGVHWPTDVLAGWAGGAAWAVLCWLVMLWLQSRRAVEPESAAGAATDRARSR